MVIQDREITQEKQKEHHLVPDVRCPGCEPFHSQPDGTVGD